ncbi:hypothetical protein [Sphingomonas sp. BK235]|uniref:hypothetical protein n=1 Tax=Sphingomonas sp. BK235 TaxID=2512131 RepID=UPI0010473663|nr:hypothetical protein [Sphingomonas sp. BK235]TCP30680.1 hypothetical protein EV292_11237 [Sphingomonas sp. BK235]
MADLIRIIRDGVTKLIPAASLGGSTTQKPSNSLGAVVGLGPRISTGQGASNTRALSYVTYRAAAPISRPRVLHSNWYLSPTNFNEINASAAASYNNWIEYPIGAAGALYGPFAGAAEPGADVVIDCGPVEIPRGASFRVWTEINGPLALSTQMRHPNPSPSIGCAMQFGAPPPNPTAPGQSLPTPFNGLGYFPAVLDDTTYRSVLLVGDSHESGLGDTLTIGNAFGPFERFYGDLVPMMQLSVQGDTLSAQLRAGNFVRRQRVMQYFSDINIGAGGGDISNGDTAATIIANLRAVCAMVPAGKKRFTTTEFPKTSSTDSFATVANQAVTANEATRLELNLFKRTLGATATQPALFDYYHDFERIVGVFNGNTSAIVWPANGTTDGVHGNELSYAPFGRVTGARFF